MVRRSRFGLFGPLFAASVLCGSALADDAPGLWVPKGGYVDVDVPNGELAQSFFLKFENVDDTRGSVGAFKLEVFRDDALVESRRMVAPEPGVVGRRNTVRAFDRLRIADGEGWVSAKVTEVLFCPGRMPEHRLCAPVAGPTPGQVVSISPTSVPIAGLPDTGWTPGSETDNATGGVTTTGGGGDLSEDYPDTTTISDASGSDQSARDTDTSDQAPQPASPDDLDPNAPFHGETTPISRLEGISVQAGPFANANYLPYSPWVDQAKLSTSWAYYQYGTEILARSEVEINDNGMPVFPEDHNSADGYYMSGGAIWAGAKTQGSADVAGTWRLKAEAGVVLYPRLTGGVLEKISDNEFLLTCTAGEHCLFRLGIYDMPADALAPTLVRIRDGAGQPTRNEAIHANGEMSREEWRKSVYGYTDLRTMHMSGATSALTSPIRFDHFAKVVDANWANQQFFVPFRLKATDNGTTPWSNLVRGTGMKRVYSPVEARLRLAFETGTVYHHNFPHLFMAQKGDLHPEEIAQWAVDLFERDDITDDQKEALFNDYELQHVDEFGALIAAHQDLLVDNKIKVEVGNETWNWARPYNIGTQYFLNKGERYTAEKGWGNTVKGLSLNTVQTGYELTKAVARLRKMYPQIEWRGIMAVQTIRASSWHSQYAPGPETDSGMYNLSLHALKVGYDLFWAEYNQNQSTYAEMYASEPSQPGDWFEAHGTTYFELVAKRDDMRTHLGGFEPTDLLNRINDVEEWPGLRRELLDFFVDPSSDLGELTGERGLKTAVSSLDTLSGAFLALAETAEAYGMDLASYEGGTHASIGSYYTSLIKTNDALRAFWRDFHSSVEMGIIQAAVHDAAISAGWKGLSDFTLFEGATADYIFGTRRSFDDVTPRWCEYVRWMAAEPDVPVGLQASSGVVPPAMRCGSAMIDYLNQAKANGYYYGQEIPAAADLLP